MEPSGSTGCPTKLRFGGQKYFVKFVTDLKQRGKVLLGLCVYEKNEILLNPDQGLDSLKSTLLHEAIHAGANALDWDAKEATVIKIEKLIFSLLRENPGFIRWLLQRDAVREVRPDA